MRDKRPNEQTVKIELLSQWKLEAEFRNNNPVKIFGFVKQLCGILKKPVEKINSYEIQWLHYFAIIINKISNFTAQQASSNLN